MSGQRLIGSLWMIALLGMNRANDRELVHVLGDARQQLGNPDAWNFGGDRLQVAVGFRIPSIHLGGAAFQPEQDAGLGLGAACWSGGGEALRGAQKRRQADAERA